MRVSAIQSFPDLMVFLQWTRVASSSNNDPFHGGMLQGAELPHLMSHFLPDGFREVCRLLLLKGLIPGVVLS